jgi:hypothetical protein
MRDLGFDGFDQQRPQTLTIKVDLMQKAHA